MTKVGRYGILEQIGRGHAGTMFKALDPLLDRLVTFIVVPGGLEVMEELHSRFYREARTWARLNHPNIATVYEFGQDDNLLFVALEYIGGEDLGHLIAHKRNLSLRAKLSLMVQICDGLHHAHQNGIVHGRIEPGSIFVQPTGQVKILGFGIDHGRGAGDIPDGVDPTTGALRYMAPEQVWGRVDRRSDIFAVAAVFYELLTLRPAFASEDPSGTLAQILSADPTPVLDLGPTIPPSLATAIERALRKDPAQRVASLAEMRAELELALVDEIFALPAAPTEEAGLATEGHGTAAAVALFSHPETGRSIVPATARTGRRALTYRQLAVAVCVMVALGTGAIYTFRPLPAPTPISVSGQAPVESPSVSEQAPVEPATVTASVGEPRGEAASASPPRVARLETAEITAKQSVLPPKAPAGTEALARARAVERAQAKTPVGDSKGTDNALTVLSGERSARTDGGQTTGGARRKAALQGDRLQGASGPVAWEVADVRLETVSGSREVRWSYTLVVKDLSNRSIQFDREERSASRGFTDATISREARRERLDANSELRLPIRDTIRPTTPEASFAPASRAQDIWVWHRLYGRDERGAEVRIDIRFPLLPA